MLPQNQKSPTAKLKASSTRVTTQVKGVTGAKVEAIKSPFSGRSLQRIPPTISRNSSLLVEIQSTISKPQDLQNYPLLSSLLLHPLQILAHLTLDLTKSS